MLLFFASVIVVSVIFCVLSSFTHAVSAVSACAAIMADEDKKEDDVVHVPGEIPEQGVILEFRDRLTFAGVVNDAVRHRARAALSPSLCLQVLLNDLVDANKSCVLNADLATSLKSVLASKPGVLRSDPDVSRRSVVCMASFSCVRLTTSC